MQIAKTQLESGMELRDLLADEAFRRRKQRLRDPARESVALRRLCRVFAEDPESALQELVNVAVEFCHANQLHARRRT
jgi:DNA-binding PucR family transcriptional regulator